MAASPRPKVSKIMVDIGHTACYNHYALSHAGKPDTADYLLAEASYTGNAD
jgi:hypothetical protein